MNNRANIMYFIEHLCEVAQREGHLDFVRMMQRDILRVVDAVAPSDGSGAANVKVVRRVSTLCTLCYSNIRANAPHPPGPSRPPAKIHPTSRNRPRNRSRSRREGHPNLTPLRPLAHLSQPHPSRL